MGSVGLGDPLPKAIAEDLGIGEEERRVEPVEEEAGDLARVRVEREVVVSLDAVGPSEDRIVWPPRALDELDERQPDGDEDTFDDADEGDTEEGHERKPELRRTDPPQPDHRSDVRERQAGGDDDCREGARRQGGEEIRERDEQHADEERPDDPGELGLGSRRLRDRRPRRAAADGHARQESRRKVRSAEADQFPVLADLLAAPDRQAPRQDAHVGGRHERDAERRGQQGDDVARVDRRDR